MKNYFTIFAIISLIFMLPSCTSGNGKTDGAQAVFTGEAGEVRLIVLAPGHFHASLLQKNSMPRVNDSVFVYAPERDAGLEQYLSAIESFNQRDENPTRWEESVYTGEDFLEQGVANKRGNVVVLAGNNRDKTEYILAAVEAGLHVLSDKPMAINREDFYLLEEAYSNADATDVLMYDMMTERYDMLNIIEKELINDQELFGELRAGSPDSPAIYMESVHHFYKEVAGTPLIRPAWYYDVEQQGEGIADVTTHLIDQLFWKCFPGQPIDYNQDIGEISSTHWPTDITLSRYGSSTGELDFPDYLQKDLDDSTLKVYANGTIHFDVKGHHAALKVLWNWQAPEGSGDTFMSEIKGTKAILKTEQDKAQGFVKQLYVQRPGNIEKETFEENLDKSITTLQAKYPFLSYTATANEDTYLINIPPENREGHESHFTYVAERFFQYLVDRDMPDWEKANTLAKYYITTKAVERAVDRN
jgi:predicted dehydrogenase